MVAAGEPGDHWLGSHVRSWSDDIGLESLVGDLMKVWPALAFGVGLAFGLTFDTTGPRTEPVSRSRRDRVKAAAGESAPEAREEESDDRRVRLREGETPQPEASPRSSEPRREE
jgi:hypothetical protein